MTLPTPLTAEADTVLSQALMALRRGHNGECELRIRQAAEIVRASDEARKEAIYVLNTGKPRKQTA